MTRPLISFYSRTGTTRQLARLLARDRDARLFDITDLKSRQGLWGNIGGGVDALLKRETAIDPVTFDLRDHDPVLLGAPVWMGHLPPALLTFIRAHKARLTGRVGFFCTYNGGGEKQVCRQVAALLDREIPCLCVGKADDPHQVEKKALAFMSALATARG